MLLRSQLILFEPLQQNAALGRLNRHRMKIKLSLERLPTFETSSFFSSLDDDLLEPLAAFPETSIRARVGLRFLQQVGGSADHLGVKADEESVSVKVVVA